MLNVGPNLGQIMQAGLAHHQAGRLADAERAYREVLRFDANHADALHMLGVLAAQVRRGDVGETLIRRSIAVRAGNAEAHCNLGKILQEGGRWEEAIAEHRQALAIRPEYPEALHNLGSALYAQGQMDDALAAFSKAVSLRPGYADVHYNIGNVLAEKGRHGEAIGAYRQCLALSPQHAEAHANLAGQLLLTEDFAAGWREYEWRWKVRDFTSPPRNFAQPRWDGEDLAGGRILIHAEQGIGDIIQFLRYVPLVVARGGQVILECRPEMRRLAETSAEGWRVVAAGAALPAFDVHCPLLSLPLVFDTRLETIPEKVPYMKADAALAEKWRNRLAGVSSNRKVGLAWAGNPGFKFDHLRSPRELAALAPLGLAKNVEFVSLQKGKAASQTLAPPPGVRVLDWTGELSDFADTAALVAGLDLVISSDTAAAHLAGAMGKPTFVMLPAIPDWRWLRERENSPWYPTARLFRQSAAGRWDDVVARVTAALA